MANVYGNITSANATAVLVVETIFPNGIELQQFSTDQAVSMDNITMAVTRMGVDGKMAAGYVPAIYPITIMLEASSPSAAFLWQISASMQQAKDLYECTLTARIPSINRTYIWSGGVLKTGTLFPSEKQVLDPTTWQFDFAQMTVSEL